MSGFTFGANQPTSQPSTGFNFGTQQSQAQPSTTFGTPATTASTVGFGNTNLFSFPSSTATTSSGTTFGSTNPTSFGLNTFSFNNPTTTQSFLPSFQSATNTTALSGGFGSSSFFNKQQQQQTSLNFASNNIGQQFQQPQQNPNQPIGSLFSPKIYNDERDNIVGLFNSLQAFWGIGKAYYSAFCPPYQFDESVQYNRFKTICYSEIQTDEKDNDHKVFFLLKVNSDEAQLKTNLLTFEQNFKQIMGNNYSIKLELKNILPDSKAIISMTVTENSTSKVIPESQLRNYFCQPNSKQQLNNIFGGCFIETLFSSLSKQELNAYLSMPPKGIDERIWIQAKLENPDPNRFTPLPLIGFSSLNNRFKMQEKEIQQQQMRLKQIIDNVTSLESDVSQFKAKLEECRRRHANLSYQVLKKMISQEVHRKRTLPIQAEEDKLRANLETIQSEINVPTKFQGCLNELMSQLRQMQCQSQLTNTISPDKAIFSDYKQFLIAENAGIMNLVNLLKQDMEDINRLSRK